MRGMSAALCLAVMFVARTASADVAACVQTEDRGHLARDAGRLLEARTQFRSCSASGCPTEIRDACAEALVETEQRVPSIVVEARDDEHRLVKDAHVLVDGLEISPVTDDCELMIDPGDRIVRIERQGYLPVTIRMNVREGSHGVPVHVALMRPRYDEIPTPIRTQGAFAIPAQKASSSGAPGWALPLALAGVSVFTAGFYAGLTSARDHYDDSSRAQLQITAATMVPIGAAAFLFGLYEWTKPSRRAPATAAIARGTF